ncbi:MAG: phosphogluconate dehydrogenase (NAD(+)-dependent, decarboxylating) [Vicinamibacterales bacterium]
MELGFVGLGKMGHNMVARLVRAGHTVVAYDLDPNARRRATSVGAVSVDHLDGLVARLAAPRAVWVMVPAGPATESTITGLSDRLSPGDVILDGGNTHFPDDLRRADALAARGIAHVDVGTSGGIWGLDEGYCLMIGGEAAVCERLDPIFRTLAPPEGYLRVGDHGAGHYVKMVHNGIEYGLMQAYAEGFELMQASPFALPLQQIAALWMRGSVVRSWLLELTARALADDPGLASLSGHVSDSGEGRWTLQDAVERAVPMPVLSAALFTRFRSRADNPYGERLLAALRRQFGGHAVVPAQVGDGPHDR